MDVMKNKYMLLFGLVGLFIGLGFGLLINSVLLAIVTAVVAGSAMGGVFDLRDQLPPDQIL